MSQNKKLFSIGEAATRCGVSTSALRFYERKNLIRSIRTEGNQRLYHSSMLRTISVIKAAQQLGITLDEVSKALAVLPDHRTPNKKDWQKLSQIWAQTLDQRILELQRLRNNLDTCIGCGCLSLKSCLLFNSNDHMSSHGSGPRYLIEGIPEDDETSTTES